MRNLGVVMLVLAVLAGCGSEGSQAVTVHGELYYRERMALPPNAVAEVLLADVSRADAPAQVLVTEIVPSVGRQVPLPFALTYDPARLKPSHSYVLRATVRNADGELIWTTDTAQPLPDSKRGEPVRLQLVRVPQATPQPASQPGDRAGETFVYECEDLRAGEFEFTVRSGPGEIALWLPQRFAPTYRVLSHVEAASGAKYQEGDVVVWTKGDSARLEVAGETFPDCRLNRQRSIWEHAKLSGVNFRAVGNEPGWHLEIRNGQQMRFVYDYGQQEVVTPAPEPVEQHATAEWIYRAQTEDHELTAKLQAVPCVDSMSGESFPTTVTVVLDRKRFVGCGRPLH